MPSEQLDAERGAHQALQRAFRSAVEQAARCAGANHEAVRLKELSEQLQERLTVAEAAAASSTQATEAAQQALVQLQGGGGAGVAGGADAVLQLEARLQALQISEAAALSRSEAAERVLADAQAGRRELAARLEEVEAPVAEARERLREAETTLAEANQQVAQLRAAADADGRTKPSWELVQGAVERTWLICGRQLPHRRRLAP